MRRAANTLLTPLSPLSATAFVRNGVLLAAFAVYVIAYPLSPAFIPHKSLSVNVIHSMVELVFLVDFLLMFNTSFVDKRGELVISRREIATKYVRGWFLLDLLSSAPVHLLFSGINGVGSGGGGSDVHQTSELTWVESVEFVFRVERVVHALKVAHFFWFARLDRSGKGVLTWLLYSRYSHLFRIFWIVLFIALVAHYVACAWKLLGGGASGVDASQVQAYALSYYDALQLLQGQGVAATTTAQSVFASFAVLLGSVVLAIVFGHVAVLVANFNANSTNYQRKMESVFAIMTKMQLPEPLRERIHQYYEHLWREYESLDGEIDRFFKDLSHTLELEVVLCKCMELVVHIPFWTNCSPDFQKHVALSLRLRVYLPDDFIMRRGEVGDEFFMINRGSVELATGPDSFECAVGGSVVSVHKPTPTFSATAKITPLPVLARVKHRGDVFDATIVRPAHQQEPIAAAASSTYCRALDGPNGSEDDDDDSGGAEHHTLGLASSATTSGTEIRQLRKGQGFGEMALIMNYQRTANARAASHVELCVLSRAAFQQILVKYPDDRKKVLAAMLGACMAHNEANGVHCPLKEMVESVYDSDSDDDSDTTTDDSVMRAADAAALIMDVISPEQNDKSILFGVNTGLWQRLADKRNRDRRAGVRSKRRSPRSSRRASQSTATFDDQTAPSEGEDAGNHRPTEPTAAFQPPALAAATSSSAGATATAPISPPHNSTVFDPKPLLGHENEDLALLASQLRSVQESQAQLLKMMVSMQATVDHVQAQVRSFTQGIDTGSRVDGKPRAATKRRHTSGRVSPPGTRIVAEPASTSSTTTVRANASGNTLDPKRRPRPHYYKSRSDSTAGLLTRPITHASVVESSRPRQASFRRLRSFNPFSSFFGPAATTSPFQTRFTDQLFRSRVGGAATEASEASTADSNTSDSTPPANTPTPTPSATPTPQPRRLSRASSLHFAPT